MIYSSLQAVFVETKHIGHINRYGTAIFGNMSVYVFQQSNNETQLLWRL